MKNFEDLKKNIPNEIEALKRLEDFLSFSDNVKCYYCKGSSYIGTSPYYSCLVCNNSFTCITGTFIEASEIPPLHWCYLVYSAYIYETMNPEILSEITGIDIDEAKVVVAVIEYSKNLKKGNKNNGL